MSFKLKRTLAPDPAYDFLKREIHIGDKIVYPVASGSSSAQLVLAEVVDIVRSPATNKTSLRVTPLRRDRPWQTTPGRPNTLHRFERSVIVPEDAE